MIFLPGALSVIVKMLDIISFIRSFPHELMKVVVQDAGGYHLKQMSIDK